MLKRATAKAGGKRYVAVVSDVQNGLMLRVTLQDPLEMCEDLVDAMLISMDMITHAMTAAVNNNVPQRVSMYCTMTDGEETSDIAATA